MSVLRASMESRDKYCINVHLGMQELFWDRLKNVNCPFCNSSQLSVVTWTWSEPWSQASPILWSSHIYIVSVFNRIIYIDRLKNKMILEVSLGHTKKKIQSFGFLGYRVMLATSHPHCESKFMRALILLDRQSLGVSWWLLFQMAARKSHLKVLLIFVKRMEEVRRLLPLLSHCRGWLTSRCSLHLSLFE